MRVAFRVLLFLTLLVLVSGRFSGGRLLPVALLPLFVTWFSVSVFVFAIFGLRSAYLAWRDPVNRKAYLFDIMLAVAWVPCWFLARR